MIDQVINFLIIHPHSFFVYTIFEPFFRQETIWITIWPCDEQIFQIHIHLFSFFLKLVQSCIKFFWVNWFSIFQRIFFIISNFIFNCSEEICIIDFLRITLLSKVMSNKQNLNGSQVASQIVKKDVSKSNFIYCSVSSVSFLFKTCLNIQWSFLLFIHSINDILNQTLKNFRFFAFAI